MKVETKFQLDCVSLYNILSSRLNTFYKSKNYSMTIHIEKSAVRNEQLQNQITNEKMYRTVPIFSMFIATTEKQLDKDTLFKQIKNWVEKHFSSAPKDFLRK